MGAWPKLNSQKAISSDPLPGRVSVPDAVPFCFRRRDHADDHDICHDSVGHVAGV